MQVYLLFCFLQVYEEIVFYFSGIRYFFWFRISEFFFNQFFGLLMVDIGCGNGKYFGINKFFYQVVYILNYFLNNLYLYKFLYEIVCVLNKLFLLLIFIYFYQVGFCVIIYILLFLYYYCLYKYLQQLVNIFDILVCGFVIDVLFYIYFLVDFVNYIFVFIDRVRQKF